MILWSWKYDELMQYFDEIDAGHMEQGDVCIWANPNDEKNCHVAVFDYYNPDNNTSYYFSQNPNPCQVMPVYMNGLHAFRRKQEKPTQK